jgi:hypothetical protein
MAKPRLTQSVTNVLAPSGPYIRTDGLGGGERKNGKLRKLNLRAVAEVLAEHGFDPTVEIVRVLKGEPKVVGKDPLTGESIVENVSVLDEKTRAMLTMNLMEYAHPKLRSIEAKVTDTRGEADIDKQLAALLAKAGVVVHPLKDSDGSVEVDPRGEEGPAGAVEEA